MNRVGFYGPPNVKHIQCLSGYEDPTCTALKLKYTSILFKKK